MKKKESRKSVAADLATGLDILEELSVGGAPQSSAQIAQSLRHSLEGTRAAFQLLDSRGYIVRANENGKSRLSLKLYQLAQVQAPVEFLRSAALPPMRRLASSLQQSCHLSVVDA